MELQKLKEKAAAAFAKGKFTKAAELYAEYCKKDPRDLQAHVRMGDAWARGGKTERAIGAYRQAAEGFAKEGFLPRAIAASKLILELDPSHKGVQQMLASLYAQRNIPPPESHSVLTAGAARTSGSAATNRGGRAAAHAQSAEREFGLEESAVESFEIQRSAADSRSSTDEAKLEAGEVGFAGLDTSKEVPPEMYSTGHLVKGGSPAPLAQSEAAKTAPSAPPSAREVSTAKTASGPLPVATPTATSPRDPPRQPLRAHQAAPSEQLTAATSPARSGATKISSQEPSPAQSSVAQPNVRARAATETSTAQRKASQPTASRPAEPKSASPAEASVPPSSEDAPKPRPEISSRPTSAEPAKPRAEVGSRTTSAQASERPADVGSRPVPAEAPQPSATSAPAQSPDEGSGEAADGDALEMEVDTSSAGGEPFTELELEGDSLLHAVERAARLGMAQRAQQTRSEPAVKTANEAQPAAEAHPRKLPKVPLFSDLSADAFIELFERGPMRRFKKGERIFEQGSVGDSFYVICAGSVRVLRAEDGATKEIAVLDEGSFFGEMAILSGSPRTASVESASEETELLELSANLLSQLSARYPTVAQALKKFCRQRLLANVMNISALFQPFDSKERRALIERFRARDVNKGAAVVREGERSDGLYVVLSGEVSVSKGGRPLALLREGEIFGEMSLLTKAPATATVTAARRTSLLRLPREDFEELIMSHPQILVLVSELTDDRRRLTEAVIQGSAQAGERGLILV